jgi:RNA polymerase sigma-70 factor (ECF subfamily)
MEDTPDLVLRAQSGDGARFAELYERIAPALYTWAEIRIRPELRALLDPADLVQEVWCRAWKSFGTFDAENASFRYWVFRVAKNVLLEALRELQTPRFDARGRDPRDSSARLFELRDVPDTATSISQRLSRDERLKLFARWVAELDEDERMLIVHLGLEGLTQSEVAERLDLSREAVAKRWQRLVARAGERGVGRELLAEVASS